MRKIILSSFCVIVLTVLAVKVTQNAEANTNINYKYFEAATGKNLKVKYDEYQANLVKIEKEKEHKRTVSTALKKAAEKAVKVEDRKDYDIYTITAYNNDVASTGKRKGDKGYGLTASGEETKEGLTVSADTRLLPMGTVIYIEGYGERTVMDTGSAIKGRKLDLYFESEQRAIEFGRQKLRVWIVKEGKE